MWKIGDLKSRGRNAFYGNYWPCVGVALLLLITNRISNSRWLILFVCVLVEIFVGNALQVSSDRFFIMNQTQKPPASTLGFGFRGDRYLHLTGILALKDLYTVFWSLLFIIPGIVKYYEYLMIPYILAENPEMDREEVFQISKAMMDGNKWHAFELDLSFLGWRILNSFTFGLLNVFYLAPYRQATYSELYVCNRAEAFEKGFIR